MDMDFKKFILLNKLISGKIADIKYYIKLSSHENLSLNLNFIL